MEKKISSYNRNIILNYVFKVGAIVLGVVSVNVSLGYLGSTLYGLWVTIASIVSWMQSGDFGIGNGLRNELAVAYSKGNKKLQEELAHTAIITLSRIAVCIFGVLLFVGEGMIATGIMDVSVRIPFYVTSVFFCMNLVAGVSQSMAYALRKSWYCSCASCMALLLSTCMVASINRLTAGPDLIIFAFVHGMCTLLPNLVLLTILKNRVDFRAVCLKSDHAKIIRKKILGTGIQFFGIQICGIILYSTDNVIINYLFGSEQVTKYSIITKVYDTGNSLFSILLIELWSAVTFHIARGDYGWVSGKIRQMLRVWFLYGCGVTAVSLMFNLIVKVWLGKEAMFFEAPIILVFGVYGIVTAFSAIFTNVVNGMGTVKLQLGLAALEAIINIPLSFLLARGFGMGILGVKLATLICVMIGFVALPIQVMIIMKAKLSKSEEDAK